MSRDTKCKEKVCFLQKIKEDRQVLFGAFSLELTKQMKMDKCKEIFNYAVALDVVDTKKYNWTQIRNVYWPNIGRVTMAKIDNGKKTGTAGGRMYKLTEVDHLVLDIEGRESAVVRVLSEPSSMETEYYTDAMDDITVTYLENEKEEVTDAQASNVEEKRSGKYRGRKRECRKVKKEEKENVVKLKKLKTELIKNQII